MLEEAGLRTKYKARESKKIGDDVEDDVKECRLRCGSRLAHVADSELVGDLRAEGRERSRDEDDLGAGLTSHRLVRLELPEDADKSAPQ